jgi:hypothetical protein
MRKLNEFKHKMTDVYNCTSPEEADLLSTFDFSCFQTVAHETAAKPPTMVTSLPTERSYVEQKQHMVYWCTGTQTVVHSLEHFPPILFHANGSLALDTEWTKTERTKLLGD